MSQLTLFFYSEGDSITIQCLESDKIDDVFNKYCVKSGKNVNDLKFYYNSKEVKKNGKTLYALGVSNRSTFNVVASKYVIGA